jgi:sugar-specific transcriptional regulator TrmB
MQKELQAIGMDNKEIEIYLALTKNPSSNIAMLLKNTTIERRTIYDVLERLQQKGLASYFEENGKKYYMATKPEIILEDLYQKQQDLKKIIPQLQNLQHPPTETKVEVFKGLKGIRTIFLDIINSKETHYSFGDITPFNRDDKLIPIVKIFLSALEQKNIKEKVIYTKGDKLNKIKGGEYRAIDPKFVPPTPTVIYGDVTVQYIFTEPITIIKITSKDIASTNKKYFETFWKIAKP